MPIAKALGVTVKELLGEDKPKRLFSAGGRIRQLFEAAAEKLKPALLRNTTSMHRLQLPLVDEAQRAAMLHHDTANFACLTSCLTLIFFCLS